MNVSFGAGLLRILPSELFAVELEPEQRIRGLKNPPPRRKDQRSPTKEVRLKYLKRVAQLGVCHQFCEVVEDEVAELSFKGGNVGARWLEPGEGAIIIRTAQAIQGNMPYSALPKGLEADFYFPTFAHPEGQKITLPDLPTHGFAMGLRQTSRYLEQHMLSLPAMDRDFCRDLLDASQRCEAQRLILWLWYE